VQSRNRILEMKPTLRASWSAASVANFMIGQYQVAFDMITKYRAAAYIEDRGDAYQESELYLYQCRCLESLEKYQEALDFLQANEKHIVDKLGFNTKVAELNVLVGNFAVGKEKWLALVKDQPDNYRLHCGLQAAYLELDTATALEMFGLLRMEVPSTALALTAEQLAVLRELYATTLGGSKKGAVGKLALTLFPVGAADTDAEALRPALDAHLRLNLHNAVPALFHDVCSLIRVVDPLSSSSSGSGSSLTRTVFAQEPADFQTHPVAQLALGLVEGYITSLRACNKFDPADSKPEPPTALLWALYLKAHLQELSGNLDAALQTIEESLEHTPTALDMQGKKARLLKKMGRYTDAAVVMDECRALDLQDRYLNNKATKYFLRADEVPLAMNTIALFTKGEQESQSFLYDMQCNWYELELAESYARTKQWGPALRKFYAIQKHFLDYTEDMFDFHQFAIRKVTIDLCF
jgi:N-alpha-acetyltransferase 15/16, NatA auxiliary subunit